MNQQRSTITSSATVLPAAFIDSQSTRTMSDMDPDAELYHSCVSSAVDITDACFHGNVLSFVRSARDIDLNTKRKFLHHVIINKTSKDIVSLPVSQLSSEVKYRSVSPSGDKIAIFSTQNDESVVEIWTNGGTCLCRKIVLPKTLHGDVCTDISWFGSFSWNKEETALVYSAEMVPPKTKSYFARKEEGNTQNGSITSFMGKTNTIGYGKGEDWGEKYTSTVRLKLFILQIQTGMVAEVKNVPGYTDKTTNSGFVLGQAIFSPCGNQIVYTGWDAGGGGNMPKRLGSVYCYQRHCAIYSSPIFRLMKKLSGMDVKEEEDEDEEYTCLTPNDRLARSPRFLHVKETRKDCLIFLCNSLGFDTHGGVMGLHMMEWNEEGAVTGTKRTVVDVIDTPIDESSFPGLFVNQLPHGRFATPDGNFIFATTQWRSITKVVKIDINTGEVHQIRATCLNEEKSKNSSQQLLCVSDSGDLVITQSEPNAPPVLAFLSSQPHSSEDKDLSSDFIFEPFGVISASSKFVPNAQESPCFSYHVLKSKPLHGADNGCIEGILLLPKNEGQKAPLIVVPHGGPHSCTPTSYIPSYAFLCSSGYAILHVNYRGSSGFGQRALESLAGTAGTQDVQDVVDILNQVSDDFCDHLDLSRVGVCGGSHGGFLVGHLTGQYPSLFCCAAMRNPVTNIPGMVTATDIPDWCYIETLGINSYEWKRFSGPTKEQLSKMWMASPIAHVGNVTTPTLIALGLQDKRVPPSQGYEWYYALRSKGVATDLLVYDGDDHSIDKVCSEADHWINIKKWFDLHFGEKK